MMRLIDADALIKMTILNPDHVPYITRTDVEDTPTIELNRLEWEELLVICDNCGHAIHVTKEDAHTVEPERKTGKWIPCSERLPEGDVLCCDIHKNLMIGYVFVSESSNTGYNAESECEYMYDCIAWMPLPDPYTEEEQ